MSRSARSAPIGTVILELAVLCRGRQRNEVPLERGQRRGGELPPCEEGRMQARREPERSVHQYVSTGSGAGTQQTGSAAGGSRRLLLAFDDDLSFLGPALELVEDVEVVASALVLGVERERLLELEP